MKIWQGYGSEHSANMVIIGEFKDAAKAADARELLRRASEFAGDEYAAGRLKMDHPKHECGEAMFEFFSAQRLSSFTAADLEQLLYEHDAVVEGNRVVVTSEQSETSRFVQLFLSRAAKVQVYSAHDHPGRYGYQDGPA